MLLESEATNYYGHCTVVRHNNDTNEPHRSVLRNFICTMQRSGLSTSAAGDQTAAAPTATDSLIVF